MNYYNAIKESLINNEVYKKVKDYSKKLTNELGKEYGTSNLKNMRKFYIVFQKSQTLTDFFEITTSSNVLSWSHYMELLSFDIEKIKYYIDVTERNKLSVREYCERIKSNSCASGAIYIKESNY